MGKILKGILGGVSGLIGPVVGAVVRGVATIRSRPKKSTKPAADSQIEHRTKFGMATQFITSLSPLINIGYQAFNKTMSSTNAAVQDRLFVAIFDTQLLRSVMYTGGAIRSAGKYEATVPMYYAGHPLQVWAFFQSDDRKSISTSQYLGTTVLNI